MINDEENKYTIDDAKELWEGTINESFSPELSIKPEGIKDVSESYSNLIVRDKVLVSKPDYPDFVGSDFELLGILGEGGMGIVYRANQTSVDREVAVKMILPESAQDIGNRNKFLGEAMITANLDHPNIVPVHDLGSTADGSLFYSMKNIRGVSWNVVLEEKSLNDNLDILLKVCDAIAFAHDKGVIHRDLKPENIMLGNYGEVLLLDWGLAARGKDTSLGAKTDQLNTESGRAGTPKYMSPEMARCDFDEIGIASDIYLLGGILYEIATGLTPHAGGNVYACLYHAMNNIIQETDKESELINIALKALSMKPEDRYASVSDFQQAIKLYREHEESLTLTASARQDMNSALQTGEYELFARAVFGFTEALKQWEDNESAYSELYQVRHDYASCALSKGDLDLADSLVDENEYFQELNDKISKARKQRLIRQKHAKNIKFILAVGTAVIVLGSCIFSIWIGILRSKAEKALTQVSKEKARAESALIAMNKEKKKTEKALVLVKEEKKKATTERDKSRIAERKARIAEVKALTAKKQTEDALGKLGVSQKSAKDAKQETIRVKESAEIEKSSLIKSKAISEYGHKLKKIINLISSRNFKEAQLVLSTINMDLRGWEWNQLFKQTDVSKKRIIDANFFNFCFSKDGTKIAGIVNGGSQPFVVVYQTKNLKLIKSFEPKHSSKKGMKLIRFSPDNRSLIWLEYILETKKEIITRNLPNGRKLEYPKITYKYKSNIMKIYDFQSGKTKSIKLKQKFSIFGFTSDSKNIILRDSISDRKNNKPRMNIRIYILSLKKKQNPLFLFKFSSTARDNSQHVRFCKNNTLYLIDSKYNQSTRKYMNKVSIYNVLNKKLIVRYTWLSRSRVNTSAVSRDGHYLLKKSENTIILFDIYKKRNIKSFTNITANITRISRSPKFCFSKAGKSIVIYGIFRNKLSMEIYNINGRKKQFITEKLPQSNKPYWDSSIPIFSANDNYIGFNPPSLPPIGHPYRNTMLTRNSYMKPALWRISDGVKVSSKYWNKISPDEKSLLILDSGKLYFDDINQNMSGASKLKSIAVSPDCKFMLKINKSIIKPAGSNNRITNPADYRNSKIRSILALYDFKSDKKIFDLMELPIEFVKQYFIFKPTIRTNFSIDSNRVFVRIRTRTEHTIVIFDVTTGKQIKKIRLGLDSPYHQVHIMPGKDDICFISGNSNKINIAGTNKALLELKNANIIIKAFCLSPDGNIIVTYDSSSHITLWDRKSGQSIKRFTATLKQPYLSIYPEKSRLVALCSDGSSSSIAVFELKSGVRLVDIPFKQYVTDRSQLGISFTEDGDKVILTGLKGERGEPFIW